MRADHQTDQHRGNAESSTAGMASTEPVFIGLAELSKRLSLSPRTIRAHVRRPERPLPAHPIGGKLLFDWDRVVAWVEGHRVKRIDVETIVDDMVTRLREMSRENRGGNSHEG